MKEVTVRARRDSRVRTTLTPAAAAVAAVAALASLQAQAQQTQQVQVTGIRSAIESAISVKKNADGVVEAINAEDIGKLPDVTVAETIARLPGLATQRSKATGRAQSISVRGLAPDFSTGTLNGREQASNSDGRSVDFDQFPAELLSGVVVYKSGDAAQMNQGLAATVDLKTIRPLDMRNRVVSVNTRNTRSGIGLPEGEGQGKRQSLSYVDQFADRKLGVALGFTRFTDVGASQLKFNGWSGAEEVTYQGAKVKVPGAFTADTERTTTERTGRMAVIQFKPSGNFESTLDYFASSGDFRSSKNGLEGVIYAGWGGFDYVPQGMLSNATISNGIATSGTMSNYKGTVRNHVEASQDSLKSMGWNSKLKVGAWTNALDISRSENLRENSRYETTAGIAGDYKKGVGTTAPLGSISWTGYNGRDASSATYTSSLDYSSRSVAVLTDVNGWSGGANSPQAGYISLPTVKDKIDAVRLSGKRDVDLGPLQSLELGVNITERSKSNSADEGRLVINAVSPYAGTTVPGDGVGVAGTTGIKIVQWDPTGSLGTIYRRAEKVDTDILNKSWEVAEKVTTAYARSDLETKMLGRDVRGNVGVQFVSADQEGTGYLTNSATCTGNTAATCPSTRKTSGTSYSDVLPSLNLAMALPNDSVLRFAMARQVTRPNMNDMRGSVTFGLNPTATGGPRYEGSAGNPFLKPFRANTFDLSYEKYFGTRAYVAVAGFAKDLDTYIYRQNSLVNFSTYGITLPTGVSPVGLLTRPENGTGGTMRGMELTASLPFNMLAQALDGFGVQLNHSLTNSSVSLPASGFGTNDVNTDKLPLPGLSKNVSNMRLYFEKAGFQIAVAGRKRSDFLGEITDFQDKRQLTFVKGETAVDLQLAYEFRGGYAKGLSLLFQGNNLSRTEFQRYRADTGAVVEKVPTGRVYILGANYKF